MYGYKIIQEGDQFYFEIYPNNNKNQRVGQSNNFSTKEECKEAVMFFCDWVKNNQINSKESPYIRIEKIGKHHRTCYVNEESVIFTLRAYVSPSECDDRIKSIFKHIDECRTVR